MIDIRNNYLSPNRITIIEYGDMVHAQDIEAGGGWREGIRLGVGSWKIIPVVEF